MVRRAVLAGALYAASGCGEGAAPVPRTPASMETVAVPPANVAAGSFVGDLTVRVVDAGGVALPGVVVHFRVTQGAGRLASSIDTTSAGGSAAAPFTASSVPGPNEVSVTVNGLAPVRFTVTGVAGPTQTLSLNARAIRLSPTQDSAIVSAVARDAFGNATGDPVQWNARDTTLVTVSGAATATVAVRRRPGQTWVVGAAGAARDSVQVTVHDSTSNPCDFIATPTVIPLGGTLAMDNGAACVSATSPGAEYALVLHHNTHASSVSTGVEITASGILTPQTAFPLVVAEPAASDPDWSFERSLRSREAREVASRLHGAREWNRKRSGDATGLYTISANAQVGDLVDLNVNAFDFCANPEPRQARVAAVTSTAVVLADTSNPAGGFTDEEYRSFGLAFDTLVHPVITQAFGTPTDIDGNSRVGILFTKAVNELTGPSAPGIVLGFYYLRDLLPVRDPLGDCAGSNAAEMFYVLVPDPAGTVNNNARSKDFVDNVVVATIAHEYQHLINASRRMYVTNAARVDEEAWLNEGLSHVAEELIFYHAAGIDPRGNIGATQLAAGTATRSAFDRYQRNNFARYREFLRAPATSAPLLQSDDLGVRGSAWSFLRYLVDRLGPSDGDFWGRLVNSPLTGVSNLEAVLSGSGLTVLSALRDWSVSVVADDIAPSTSPAFRQPSWDFVTGIPLVLPSFGLAPRSLSDGVPVSAGLIGGGSAYMRFGVAQGRQALVSARGNQVGLSVRLTIVRIK